MRTVHVEPMNSVHDKEKVIIEEKVIMVDTEIILKNGGNGQGEEIILKNGTPAVCMYSDRTHLYTIPSGKCWLDSRKKPSSIHTTVGVLTKVDRFTAYIFMRP